ncbi:helix-turn-helix domain-containing protein [Paenibacillus sp. strain BS8-2]
MTAYQTPGFSLDHVNYVTSGSIVYPPGGKFGPRIQQDIQLVMLYSGSMCVSIDGNVLEAVPGQVARLLPGHREEFIFAKSEETWHRWISIHVDGVPKDILEAFAALPPVLPLTEEMNRLVDLLLSVQLTHPSDSPLVRTFGLAALLLLPSESAKLSSEKEKHPSVYKALQWIREHYAENISLPDIAANSDVSPEHLVRLFRRHVQTTPVHYLWTWRIQQAVNLLVHTGLTVTEIADRCGFKTTHHLARMMKQTTGMTASRIRETSWLGLRTPSARKR